MTLLTSVFSFMVGNIRLESHCFATTGFYFICTKDFLKPGIWWRISAAGQEEITGTEGSVSCLVGI